LLTKADSKNSAAAVVRGGNFLSGPTIFSVSGMGSNKNQIIWTDFTFSGLSLTLPGFSDDGLRFGFQGWWIVVGFFGLLDEGSSGYGLKYGSYGLELGFQD
jgi:hypothetical protein